MSKHFFRPAAAVLLVGAVAAGGCTDKFYQVTDPDILEATAIDPLRDGPTLARSAFQNFVVAYGAHIVYSAWWAHEARVGDTFPTRNEFGRRFLDDTNGTLNGEVWFPIARAATTSALVVTTLKDVPGLPLAQAAFAEGYALILMAEGFCEGTVATSLTEPGPKMTTIQLLDRAIEKLTLARTEAGKLTGAEPTALANAALVGIARAHLQAGRKTEAAAAARQVPAAFVYELKYFDDSANRGRLGNNVWNFTTSRQSLVVPPEYREIGVRVGGPDVGDPRIRYDDAGRFAQDSELRFFRQQKFTGWATPIRLASGLEARYIAAEASGSLTEMITLINERRTAGRQSVFASTDPAAVLRELMEQRARDFWLEGKKMGDFRRNPTAVPYMPPAGSEYYKSGVGNIGTQTCLPVPDAEKRNNPNWAS